MKLCGLTGGVGMGKSTTARFLSSRGVPVVDTDEIAHALVEPGQPALAEIEKQFGKKVIGPDGRLRRAELARIVFADAAARQSLEAILHPRIRERWLARVDAWRKENHSLAVVVIPLLFETGAQTHFAKVLCTACSPAAQSDRLRTRGWSPEQTRQRIAAQLPADQKVARADFVIWTDGDLGIHERQVHEVLQSLG